MDGWKKAIDAATNKQEFLEDFFGREGKKYVALFFLYSVCALQWTSDMLNFLKMTKLSSA